MLLILHTPGLKMKHNRKCDLRLLRQGFRRRCRAFSSVVARLMSSNNVSMLHLCTSTNSHPDNGGADRDPCLNPAQCPSTIARCGSNVEISTFVIYIIHNFLKAFGKKPVCFLKALIKWLWSKNPQLWAIAVNERSVPLIKASDFSILILRMYSPREHLK